jgi:hypothetical protein
MKKSRTFSVVMGAMLATAGMAQSPIVLVQGPDGPSVFTNLDSAVQAAQPGDHLYLSGGVFQVPGPLVLEKPLHFIGAGIHPDSSSVTGTTTIGTASGNVAITMGASGSTFTGIAFSTYGMVAFGTTVDDDDPTDIVFQRCAFNHGLELGQAEGAQGSATFDECVIRGPGNYSLKGLSSRAVLTRCILDGCSVNQFRPSGLFMKNCVILNDQVVNSKNGVVQNCVFTYDGAAFWQVSGMQISNCLTSGSALFSNSSNNTETNNVLGVSSASIFENETDGVYQYSDDLHIAASSIGTGMGNDGTDVGIYGSGAPYKTGGAPYNPHFQQAQFDPITNWNGALPVQVRTAAQTH